MRITAPMDSGGAGPESAPASGPGRPARRTPGRCPHERGITDASAPRCPELGCVAFPAVVLSGRPGAVRLPAACRDGFAGWHPPALPDHGSCEDDARTGTALRFPSLGWGAAMVTGPGDELAASAAGRGYLRVSDAEREQVIGTVKAAFVHGMLAKDEFDLRVSQAFASRTYAELAAVTAGLPAEPAAAQPPRSARARGGQPVPRPGRVMAAATALYAGIQAFVFLSPWPAGTQNDPSPARSALFVFSNPIYLLVLLACVLSLIARWRERRSSGRPPRRLAPGAGGQASRYPPSAGPAGELPPAGRGRQHTAEADRSRPARPPRQAHGHRGGGALAGCLP